MPFRLTNVPATFQAIINNTLQECLDQFVVVYLDDIFIFLKTLEKYCKHVYKVLAKLQERNLLVELEKSYFYKKKVNFLE
jgi:predicted KAP-like P-loop ATPase